MRESTSAVVESPRAEVSDLQLTGIHFKDNDPCKPLYPSLYKPFPDAPYAGLEPAFQIDPGVGSLSVYVSLAESSDVVLIADPKSPGKPLCRVLNEPDYEPEIAFAGSDPKSCWLTWKNLQDVPKTRVFRIYCQPKAGEFTDEQKVYGGIFLAFTTHETGTMGKEIKPEDVFNDDPRKIYLIGADIEHRPIYELHSGAQPVNPKIEQEVAYRIRAKHELPFQMRVAIKGAEWDSDLSFFRPVELESKLSGPTEFDFFWKDYDIAKVTLFHAVPHLGTGNENQVPPGWTPEEYDRALRNIGVDPTIIQPPKCDPVYGVCAPDGWDYEPGTGAR
ncbi:MAG TPA: hypothetical protein VJ725_16365 [Thermoanaerobaculia bacterium]|nr:hypothetical protein [Thermoanaerobaculia bacterium]